ncbi:hypothetical protein KIH39_21210 [Telmatocola sphagniphila]|uniref:Uncharacterized protein n=1 Tax=Telmatocola sphagniphila TaxID=1123043 RepID=A0A8E6B581_9BACT|nr:hypothetical protein [Telmatocola sphagniphila]QVL31341.1 hypothetical protein KIH39_21210 [Telmatocola sphagniphila]
MDLDFLKFHGSAMKIAEAELSASFFEDEKQVLGKKMYEEYVASGAPKDLKKWLRIKLKSVFQYVDSPPKWVENGLDPLWPFLDGFPMIFIKQFELPDNEFCAQSLSAGTILYVFGARRKTSHGFEMIYRVVEQDTGF